VALDLVMTDGVKSVPLDQLPENAWRYVVGSASGGDGLSAETATRVVPILYRALAMRANAIAAMPCALYRGETEVTKAPEYQGIMGKMSQRLRLTSASLDVYGASYWIKEVNPFGRNLTPRWLVPVSLTTVTEANATERVRADVEPNEGLYGFTRRTAAAETFIPWSEMVYFWEMSLTSEVGHGDGCVLAALAAAGALNYMDRFVEAYFKRGVIKATVFQVEGNVDKGEVERAQSVLRNMMSGIRKAFSVMVLRSNFKPIVIGDSAKDTAAPELTMQKREDIAMAMGVPFSLLYSQAANYATSQTDYLTFYTQTIVPQCGIIEETLNEQLFTPLGLRFEFQPQKLEVFQASELQKAQAVAEVVGKPVLLVDEGRELLGYEPLPEDKVPPRLEGMLVADVEAGIVTKNERRARLGLEEVAEDGSEQGRRQLLAQLAIVQAAKDAGLGPQEGIALALGESLETLRGETAPAMPVAANGTGPAAGDAAAAPVGEGQADVMKALLEELRLARAAVAEATRTVERGA